MDEGQRTQASIKEEVSESGRGALILLKKEKDSISENAGIAHAYHRENPPLGNRDKTSMVLRLSPRSPIS